MSLFEVAEFDNPSDFQILDEFTRILPVLRELKAGVVHGGSGNKSAEIDTIDIDGLERQRSQGIYTQATAFQRLLTEYRHKIPYLSVIISTLLVFPTNSAGVERVFSATSWLKDALRNRMSDNILNASLHVKFNDCDLDYALL